MTYSSDSQTFQATPRLVDRTIAERLHMDIQYSELLVLLSPLNFVENVLTTTAILVEKKNKKNKTYCSFSNTVTHK